MTSKFLTTEPPESFDVPGRPGARVLLNPYPMQFLLLKEPTLKELRAAIEGYALTRVEEAWEEVLETSSKSHSSIQRIKAVSADQARFYNVSHELLVALLGEGPKAPAIRQLQKLDVEAQRKFIAPLKPASIAEGIALFPDRSVDRTGYRYLIKTLNESSDAKDFFERLLNDLFRDIGASDYALGTPKLGFHQPRILDFLGVALWNQWLLFPYLGGQSGDKRVRALLHKDCVSRYLSPAYAPAAVLDVWRDTNGIIETNSTGPYAARYIQKLFACSTYRDISESSSLLFDRCVELAEKDKEGDGDSARRQQGMARKGYNALLKLHAARCPDAPPQALLYFKKPRKSLEEFTSFPDIEQAAPHLAQWFPLIGDFLKSKTTSAQSVIMDRASCQDLLEFLASHASPPASPQLTTRALINDATATGPCYRNYLKKKYSAGSCNDKLNDAAAFFSYVQDRLRIEHRNPATEPPWFANPVDIGFDRFQQMLRSGTTRKAIAADIMEEMRKVLVENDYEWAKQIESEWTHLVNDETKELEHVWCPSATLLLYTLLSIPLRGLQARMLDSGEGDAEIFDFDSGKMVPNPRQLPVDNRLESGRKEGFIQVMTSGLPLDPFLTGLWISTNKTSDDGYPIPWVSDELLVQLKYQRDWIFRYTRNPAMHGIDEAQGRRSTPEELLQSERKFFCLFRDPSASVEDSLPVSKQKLRKLWGALCLEVQTRINAKAVDEFHRVTLVKDKEGPPESRYDIHTLRVSGITDLLDRGVPLKIVSEYVAGHATYMMTIWYDSPTPGDARRAMSDAHAKFGKSDGALPRFSESEVKDMLPFLVGNSQYKGMYTGFDALEEHAGLVQVRQAGICPGTRCEEGGLTDTGRIAPVPVGDRGPSCPQCRFFLTGPAFLLGQAIEGNQLILKIRAKVAALAKNRERILDAEDAQDGKRVALLRDQANLEERQLNDMLTEWWHRMTFYENSIQRLEAYRAVSAEKHDSEAQSIVLVRSAGTSKLNFGFSQATQLELKHFMSTCTELLPELVDESLSAHQDIELAMGKFLAINDQSELTSMFFKLDEQQRLSAANLMVELVNRAARSPIQAEELLEGKIKLNGLPGLQENFSKLIVGMSQSAVGTKKSKKVLVDA